MWITSEGNIVHTSSKTAFMKAMVESLPAQYTSLKTPQFEGTGRVSPVQPSQGYAASAARQWPGISISGMTCTCRAAAKATMPSISSRVYAPPVTSPSASVR